MNWYALESMAHLRLAELRDAVAACRGVPASASAPPAARSAAAVRLGRRLLTGLAAARAAAVRLLA
jgi:hypothetical protein